MTSALLALSSTNSIAAAGLIVCLVLGAVVLLWKPRPGSARIGKPKSLDESAKKSRRRKGNDVEELHVDVEETSAPDAANTPTDDADEAQPAGEAPAEDAENETRVGENVTTTVDEDHAHAPAAPDEVEDAAEFAVDDSFWTETTPGQSGGTEAWDGFVTRWDDAAPAAEPALEVLEATESAPEVPEVAEPTLELDEPDPDTHEVAKSGLVMHDTDTALGLEGETAPASTDGAGGPLASTPPRYTGPQLPRAPLFDAEAGQRAAKAASRLRSEALRYGADDELRPLFGEPGDDLAFPGALLATAIMSTEARTNDSADVSDTDGPDPADAIDEPVEVTAVLVDEQADTSAEDEQVEVGDVLPAELDAEPEAPVAVPVAWDAGLWDDDGADAPETPDPMVAEDPLAEISDATTNVDETSSNDIGLGLPEAPTGWAALPAPPPVLPVVPDIDVDAFLEAVLAGPDHVDSAELDGAAAAEAAEVQDATAEAVEVADQDEESAGESVWVAPSTGHFEPLEPETALPPTRLDAGASRREMRALKARDKMLNRAAREAEREAARSQRRLDKAAEREAREAERARKAARKLSGTRLASSSRRRARSTTPAEDATTPSTTAAAPAIVVERVDHEALGLPEPIPPRRRTS